MAVHLKAEKGLTYCGRQLDQYIKPSGIGGKYQNGAFIIEVTRRTGDADCMKCIRALAEEREVA